MAFEMFFGEKTNIKPRIRRAVRGICIEDDKILMVRNNRNDYKFPGGGVNDGETDEEALKREVEEETGYNDIDVGKHIGTAIQQHKLRNGEFFEMKSVYYLIRLKSMSNTGQKLDEYEKDMDFKAEFIDIQKAYDINKSILEMKKDVNSWVERETSVLEWCINKIEAGEGI